MLFSELEVGDKFMFEGKIWIKTEVQYIYLFYKINAVQALDDNISRFFKDEDYIGGQLL